MCVCPHRVSAEWGRYGIMATLRLEVVNGMGHGGKRHYARPYAVSLHSARRQHLVKEEEEVRLGFGERVMVVISGLRCECDLRGVD